MTLRDELHAHLSETGESMRALSLRAGLNAKCVSDIPEDCRRKAGFFLVYLCDRQILPSQITTETLADYVHIGSKPGL